jgi:hypothetical protein
MAIVYLEHDGKLAPMKEEAYDAEDVLQRLLAQHPDLIGGGEEGHGLMLISREVGVPDEEEGSDRWSLDHLFVDRRAMPTFVEVKRSSDTRLRREVVGQMLDYAAQGAAHWSVESLSRAFTESCDADGRVAMEQLADLGVEVGLEEFMEQVHANLRAGRLRLLFVADHVPAELRLVIEFLNENMPDIEVLAVEVHQYVEKTQEGEEMEGRRVLVPQIIGDTEAAKVTKSRRQPWSESELLAAFDQWTPPEEGRRMRMLYEELTAKGAQASWSKARSPGVWLWLGKRPDPSESNPVSIGLITAGGSLWVAISFVDARDRRSENEMRRLAALMRSLPGVAPYIEGLEDKNWGMVRSMAPADVLPSDDAVNKWVDAVVEAARVPD